MPRARSRRWLAYYRTALDHINDEPPAPFRVVVDGRMVAPDAAVAVVANVEAYGPWLPLTPEASPVDGLFDVFILGGATRRQVFLELLRRPLRLPGRRAAGMLYRGRRSRCPASAGRTIGSRPCATACRSSSRRRRRPACSRASADAGPRSPSVPAGRPEGLVSRRGPPRARPGGGLTPGLACACFRGVDPPNRQRGDCGHGGPRTA